ncbi:MAG: 4Fe-4S binding protein [Candidatus Latescibacteria bacterium]|nr:4Fe-4S binding protein [Candidatus Latescibacterota bacterium]NIO29023.1 4Fe-4S binding protein [Candidatus Latescibacterota bacterium]NIO56648.1 4Fe-4S binding protein [Candidatus Latescibacterota bacterium]NIT02231.1 4Fe-4S binding protein [Candidatus Latescibacterota bacterium]NIT39116.1 4Fe-4S binding protein [Candidatus Latescibacterota bacterium]
MQTEYHGRDIIAYPVKIFLEIDPLILLTTFLASHTITGMLLLSLIIVGITLILGRGFCGWLCPLGTLNDAVGYFKKQKKPKEHTETRLDRYGVKAKYYILVGILIAAVFQIHFVGILDPISLTIRSFALAISPAVNYLTHGIFDFLYSANLGPLSDASDSVHEFLKLHAISFGLPTFHQGSFLGLLFLSILGLNFVRKRFWCRFLCPLGALLGLLSRFSLLNHKVNNEECNDCGLCLVTCAGGARPHQEAEWMGAECVLCMSCESVCPLQVVSYRFGKPEPEKRRTNLKRRYLIGAGATGLAALALFRLNPVRARGNALLIRPPGSVEEEEFLRRCIKCGECMKVCITNGLQPTFMQAGFEGIWSPVLVPRIGYCEFNCTLCGQVCPTDAIEQLELEEKKKRKIGLAFIDVNRCLPYAFKMNCIVCEEHCPTSPKAILFEHEMIETEEGEMELKRPVVDPEVCIGCGICETKCPTGEKAAVYISSIGEDRSEKNRLLL